ncbi:tandem-95 repeat protein [Vibrio sp. ED004]|uniref:cadherin-like domain-containing protein n=1 Tax=Vibrio sp. ED004 TaxID=2785124 RepID=UPI00205DEA67|nr:cadherin-like domain-containing protein [Vibrio sp. ED004]UPR58671.1 tandem-95 repeat protein [Vibrio sp. ED004]
MSDGTNTTDANINVSVTDVNDAPVAGSTSYQANEDGLLTFNDEQLLANSSDIDGTVTVESVSYTGGDGIFTNNGNGTYSFAPNDNFNGDVSINVTVVDDDGATATTTADVDVIAVNDTPIVSGNVAYNVDEDGTITLSQEQLLGNASDIDGDDLTASNLELASGGSVIDNGDGSFTVTPTADFNGDLALTFDVSDGTATVATGLDLTVNPTNDLTVVSDATYTVSEDGTLTFTDEQLLTNATDIDGDDLSIESVSYNGTDGVFTDNGNGTYSFVPNDNFNGDVALDFKVSDGTSTTDANINVSVTDVNDAPVAGSTSYQANEDGLLTFNDEQLLANSSDIDGTVTVESVSYTGGDGIFTNNGNGTYSFAPNDNFNGDVSINVTVVDDDGATATTTADVGVIAVNDTPIVSGNVAYNVDEDGTITLSQEQLLGNASDIDGDDLTASNLELASGGSVIDNGDGSFTVTPTADFNGDLALTFDVSDGTATVATGLDLTVNPVNDSVVADSFNVDVGEDGTLILSDNDILANVSDIDGDSVSIESVSYTGSDGVLTEIAGGVYSFVPNDNFNGNIELRYVASDGSTTAENSINITVSDINDAPVVGLNQLPS